MFGHQTFHPARPPQKRKSCSYSLFPLPHFSPKLATNLQIREKEVIWKVETVGKEKVEAVGKEKAKKVRCCRQHCVVNDR